jgi:uncharacterized protein involved in exopolysaccharide biosynthesis
LRNFRQLPHLGSGSEVAEADPAPAAIPQHFAQPGFSPTQILAIVRAYWRLTLIIGVCVTVVTAVLVKMLPKTYMATATLIVNYDNKDPLAGQQFPLELLGAYVATQMELIVSPVILLPVVDRLQLAADPEFGAGVNAADPDARREAVEKNLAAALEVDMGRGGQLLYVSVSSKNPIHAAKIANAVVDSYLEQERRRINDPAGERAQRYSEQLAELRDKVTAAQDKVTAFRQQNHITDIAAANADTETQALTNLEQRLLEAQNQRRALESKAAGQQSTADEVLASQPVQLLKSQLSTEESQLAQLSSTFGPQHPKVVELRAQIAATRRSLDAEMHTLSENVSGELSRAIDLEGKYEAAVAEQRAKVLRLRELQDEGGKLMLELDSAQSVYKRALDGYDQIMFASVGNYTNVSVVSQAMAPVKSDKPNKVKLMMTGIVAGFGLGLVLPLCYELLFNRRLRCRDDIEREFGIPVLAQFGALPPRPGTA